MAISLQMVRKFSTTSLMLRRLSKRSNPGVGHQITGIEDMDNAIQSDPEGFGNMESDLMNAHKSHKQHEFELQQQKEKIRQYLVKGKYFRKNPLPNLLTYAEKEQIKFLHLKDKEEWTVEQLAESFPASTEVISKILKTHWSPLSSKRILSHDASVLKNWERFKNGDFTEIISLQLQQHLKKFIHRDTNDLKTFPTSANTFLKTQWQKPKCNEFSSILSLRSRNDGSKNIPSLPDGDLTKQNDQGIADDDTYLLGKIRGKQPVRIKEFKEIQLKKNSADFSNTDSNKSLDQQALLELTNTNGTGIVEEKFSSTKVAAFDYTEKFSSNVISISEDDKKRFEISSVKERIHIPRKLWRKGATYRSNDCYYDDDGEFLYRVPGMTQFKKAT